VSEPNNVTNREAIRILIIIIKDDFKVLFLININIKKGRERLIVLILLDIEYRLSAIIDY
jgi:hypothetical protein